MAHKKVHSFLAFIIECNWNSHQIGISLIFQEPVLQWVKCNIEGDKNYLKCSRRGNFWWKLIRIQMLIRNEKEGLQAATTTFLKQVPYILNYYLPSTSFSTLENLWRRSLWIEVGISDDKLSRYDCNVVSLTIHHLLLICRPDLIVIIMEGSGAIRQLGLLPIGHTVPSFPSGCLQKKGNRTLSTESIPKIAMLCNTLS